MIHKKIYCTIYNLLEEILDKNLKIMIFIFIKTQVIPDNVMIQLISLILQKG